MNQSSGGLVSAGRGLSPEQRAMWAMWAREGMAHPGQAVNAVWVEVDGALDEGALHQAAGAMVKRHDALRQALVQVPGYLGWRQVELHEAPTPTLACADLTAVPGDGTAALEAWVQGFAAHPLEVEQGQVWRLSVAKTAEGRTALALAACAWLVDPGSLQVLMSEIFATLSGQGLPADEEVFQHGQFVDWRNELAQEIGEESVQGQAYWVQALPPADEQQVLALCSHQRNDAAASAGIARASLASDVLGVAASHAMGLEALLQATWWLLLARLNGHEPFMAGWQHDCRRDYEVMQGGVGVFDKVLPWHIDLAASDSLGDWLSRFGQAFHQHVQAQEYWPVDAPPATAHLAAGFSFTEVNADTSASPQAAWPMRAQPASLPCFALVLAVTASQGRVELAVHTHPSQGPRVSAGHLLAQYTTLLEAIPAAKPSTPVSTLPLVGPAEQEALLAWSQGQAFDAGAATVVDRIVQWAERTPHAPAIESGEQVMSYAELLSQANATAAWMKRQGVGHGSLVALSLPRSIELLVGILAAWRLGAGYLCLEPDWPAARHQAVIDDAKAVLVIDAPVAFDPAQRIYKGHAGSLRDTAYVLYTSGSTGAPKGVLIEQGQLLNYVAGASAAMGLASVRRWALTGSVAADLGNTALFGALFNGACLVVASQDDMRDGRAFARFMAERRIDGLKIVPSHLDALLDVDQPVLPAKLVLGGEPVAGSLVERIARLSPQCEVFNHYGPTEGTVGVMVHRVQAGRHDGALPLSTVLPNNRVLVLDQAMRLSPIGAVGEVYIGGPQLCRGYLNQMEDGPSPGAFVADPFLPRERLYRTGDLACVRPDGSLLLMGRADHQLKVRGFRVEPAEVEAALLAQPGVKQAVVLGFSPQDEGLALAAFVVTDEALPALGALAALRERLAGVLPNHMVPARLAALRELPRLANGKIDRRTLVELALSVGGEAAVHVPPSDAVEFVVAGAIAQLLVREAIGMQEDFFDLGGHSLLVIKLVARLRKLLKVEVAPGVVFDHPTVPALARALREAASDAGQLLKLAELQRQLALMSPAERADLAQRSASRSDTAVTGT